MMGRELSDLAMQAKSRIARTELMEHLNDLLDDGPVVVDQIPLGHSGTRSRARLTECQSVARAMSCAS